MEAQDWINLIFLAYAIVSQVQLRWMKRRQIILISMSKIMADKMFDGSPLKMWMYGEEMLAKRLAKALKVMVE